MISEGDEKIAYIGLSEDKNTLGSLRKKGYITALKHNNINMGYELKIRNSTKKYAKSVR